MENRLWKADLGDDFYENPILFADYSDPDVIRVEDTFYMTASSFNFTPGLPILISKDLVNWKLVNYALENIEGYDYEKPQHAKGVWAPAIRFHNGFFYIYYGMPDEGIFMVKAKNPLEKWDKPVLVLEGKGYIDPCPFWDEDGKAYVIHGYAKSRIGFNSILGIFPMSEDGTCAIGRDEFVFDGTKTQKTIEGPKVYKENGYYYIFAPAGGVRTGWQTVLRSKKITGPYEERIVMEQKDSPINGPHQGAYVTTLNNESFFVHFQDKGLYGRVVHLQPMEFVNNWPVIGERNKEDISGKPLVIGRKPKGVQDIPTYLEASDDFRGEKLNLLWQWTGNHKDNFYSLNKDEAGLKLFAINPNGQKSPKLYEFPNILTQKIVTPYFEARTKFSFKNLNEKEYAGMVMFGGNYVALGIYKDKNGFHIAKIEGEIGCETQRVMEILTLPKDLKEIEFCMGLYPKNKEEVLGCEVKPDNLEFKVAYILLGERRIVATDFFPSDHTWVGAKPGIFAVSCDVNSHAGYATFDYFNVSNV